MKSEQERRSLVWRVVVYFFDFRIFNEIYDRIRSPRGRHFYEACIISHDKLGYNNIAAVFDVG